MALGTAPQVSMMATGAGSQGAMMAGMPMPMQQQPVSRKSSGGGITSANAVAPDAGAGAALAPVLAPVPNLATAGSSPRSSGSATPPPKVPGGMGSSGGGPPGMQPPPGGVFPNGGGAHGQPTWHVLHMRTPSGHVLPFATPIWDNMQMPMQQGPVASMQQPQPQADGNGKQAGVGGGQRSMDSASTSSGKAPHNLPSHHAPHTHRALAHGHGHGHVPRHTGLLDAPGAEGVVRRPSVGTAAPAPASGHQRTGSGGSGRPVTVAVSLSETGAAGGAPAHAQAQHGQRPWRPTHPAPQMGWQAPASAPPATPMQPAQPPRPPPPPPPPSGRSTPLPEPEPAPEFTASSSSPPGDPAFSPRLVVKEPQAHAHASAHAATPLLPPGKPAAPPATVGTASPPTRVAATAAVGSAACVAVSGAEASAAAGTPSLNDGRYHPDVLGTLQAVARLEPGRSGKAHFSLR